ncbi:hypothetical protein [Bacillus thuringiensis]|uniref:hypothetical protein n=1 Tax=Bacillus thuringiensis TaxID=1428 RepID=UPI000BFE0CFC|nr:hypothetical protein [Bacillus thuringiensis]PGT90107.1 hypothetical protein COD17_10175 [Bacillus thuringiensis]
MNTELQKENEVRKDMMGLRVARGESICVVSDSKEHIESLLNELEERAKKNRQVTGKAVHRGMYLTGQEDMLVEDEVEDEQWLIGFRDIIKPERLQDCLKLMPSITSVFVFLDGNCVQNVEREMLVPNEDSHVNAEEEDSFRLSEEETRLFVETSLKTGGSAILIADKVSSTHELVGEILSKEYFRGSALFGDNHILRQLHLQYALTPVKFPNHKKTKDTTEEFRVVREHMPVHLLNAKAEQVAQLLEGNAMFNGGSLITLSKREFERLKEISLQVVTHVRQIPAMVMPKWVELWVTALLVGIGGDGKITSITTITEEMQGDMG